MLLPASKWKSPLWFGRFAEIAVVDEIQEALELIGVDLDIAPGVGDERQRVLKIQAIAQARSGSPG